jgi:LPXTG-site transpeptidase (sortase) family protein
MNIRFNLSVGVLFIAAGLLVGQGSVVELAKGLVEKDRVVSTAQEKSAETQTPQQHQNSVPVIEGRPVRIVIPSLGIDLRVIDGSYRQPNFEWTLSKDKAQFATNTQQPNNISGNTFIYGHNNKYVFSKLPAIKPGEQAIVYTDNGHRFTYSYKSAQTVKPQTTEIFNYRGGPRLTLQTCTGFWYENRSLYRFDLVEAQ